LSILEFTNGTTYADLESINQALAPLRIKVDNWETPSPNPVAHFIHQNLLDEAERETVLQFYDISFQQLLLENPIVSRDLLVLHADDSYIDTHLQKFSSFHTHNDQEGRYIVDGECIFGFALPDHRQVKLTLHSGDYLRVPPYTEHWFTLTAAKRLKAIRYFTFTDEWTTEYTDRAIAPEFSTSTPSPALILTT
jgi:1,2-dihydroxy-3-keto-5-methylthiopentene dioxygenase